ncbi:hypothetical protein [Ralstonia sp. NFACC01]|jgi:hypothetical protein|nr:hypothetical protein [Ralstonia sp. NFACC01]SFQ27368.1 hypothetical protein SAMN03159417_04854 [Ralstonia sp. NFACC01]
MSQNLISLQLSTTDLAALDSALKTIEDKLIRRVVAEAVHEMTMNGEEFP